MIKISFSADFLASLVFLGGAGQLVLCAISLIIPRILEWSKETQCLSQLTRRVFWTYAAYILATNLAFSLLSLLSPQLLLDKTILAACVAGFISAYWIGRLVIQFVWFSEANPYQTVAFRCAEYALVGLFVYLAVVYTAAAVFNIIHLTT